MWLVSAEFILRTESVSRCDECSAVVFHVSIALVALITEWWPCWGERGASSFK